MSTTDTLRMPEHIVPEPHPDTQDLYHAHKGIICRASRVPGYTHMNPDGTLHCNRCGWVTPESVITAYSPDTDSTYLTWDDLVAAEANGWVVVGMGDPPSTVPTRPATSSSDGVPRLAPHQICQSSRPPSSREPLR